jgi:hypothetical protein
MHQRKEEILLLISFAMKNPLVNDFTMLSIEVPSPIKFCLFVLFVFSHWKMGTTVDPDVDVAQRRDLLLIARPRGTYLVTAGRANNLARPPGRSSTAIPQSSLACVVYFLFIVEF